MRSDKYNLIFREVVQTTSDRTLFQSTLSCPAGWQMIKRRGRKNAVQACRFLSVCLSSFRITDLLSGLFFCSPSVSESSIAIDVVCCKFVGACRWQKKRRDSSENFMTFWTMLVLRHYVDAQSPSCTSPGPTPSTRTKSIHLSILFKSGNVAHTHTYTHTQRIKTLHNKTCGISQTFGEICGWVEMNMKHYVEPAATMIFFHKILLDVVMGKNTPH